MSNEIKNISIMAQEQQKVWRLAAEAIKLIEKEQKDEQDLIIKVAGAMLSVARGKTGPIA